MLLKRDLFFMLKSRVDCTTYCYHTYFCDSYVGGPSGDEQEVVVAQNDIL